MTDTNKTPEIPIYFKWVSCEADPRPYKPGKPILEPVEVLVKVLVPLTNTYVANTERIVTAQISNQNVEKPILTPQGMKYCIEQLENAMSPHENNFAETLDDFETREVDIQIDWEE